MIFLKMKRRRKKYDYTLFNLLKRCQVFDTFFYSLIFIEKITYKI